MDQNFGGQLWLQIADSSGLFESQTKALPKKRGLFRGLRGSPSAADSAPTARAGASSSACAIVYFRISVGGQRARSTSQILGAPSPAWHEEFVFATQNRAEERIHLELYDRLKQEAVLPDRVVGECFIPVSRLPEDQEVDSWYQLSAVDAQKTPLKAAVRLRMRFQSALQATLAPPPDPASPQAPKSTFSGLSVLTSGGLGAGLGLGGALSPTADEGTMEEKARAAWQKVETEAARQLENSESMAKGLESVNLPVALLDYVVFCGPKETAKAIALNHFAQEIAVDVAAGAREGTRRPVFWVDEGDAEMLHKFPKVEHEDLQLPTKVEWFCYPNGIQFVASRTRPEPRLSAFVMESSGERCFVVALQYFSALTDERTLANSSQQKTPTLLWAPYCMALLSRYAHLPPLRDILLLLHGSLLEHAEESQKRQAELAIGQLLAEVPLPIPGALSVRYLGFGTSIDAPSPPIGGLPVPVYGLGALFSRFSLEAIIDLWTAVLLEQKIVFHAADYAVVPAVTEALRTLLYPLRWQHLYVPVLPNPLLDYLEAPVPFILGVGTDVLSCCEARLLSDILVVDCDRGVSTGRPSGLGIGLGLSFPESLRVAMVQHLRRILGAEVKPVAEGLAPFPSSLGSIYALCVAQHGGIGFSGDMAYNVYAIPEAPAIDPVQVENRYIGETLQRWPTMLPTHGCEPPWLEGAEVAALSDAGNIIEHGIRLTFIAALSLALFRIEECIYHLGEDLPVFNEPSFLEKSARGVDFSAFLRRLAKTESFQLLIGKLDAPELDAFAKVTTLTRSQTDKIDALAEASEEAARAKRKVQLAQVDAATTAADAGEHIFSLHGGSPSSSPASRKAGVRADEHHRALATLLRCQAEEQQLKSKANERVSAVLGSLADGAFHLVPMMKTLERDAASVPGTQSISSVLQHAQGVAQALQKRSSAYESSEERKVPGGSVQREDLKFPPTFVCGARETTNPVPRRHSVHSVSSSGSDRRNSGGSLQELRKSESLPSASYSRGRRRRTDLGIPQDTVKTTLKDSLQSAIRSGERRSSEYRASESSEAPVMQLDPQLSEKIHAALAGQRAPRPWLDELDQDQVEEDIETASMQQWTFGDTPPSARKLSALLMKSTLGLNITKEASPHRTQATKLEQEQSDDRTDDSMHEASDEVSEKPVKVRPSGKASLRRSASAMMTVTSPVLGRKSSFDGHDEALGHRQAGSDGLGSIRTSSLSDLRSHSKDAGLNAGSKGEIGPDRISIATLEQGESLHNLEDEQRMSPRRFRRASSVFDDGFLNDEMLSSDGETDQDEDKSPNRDSSRGRGGSAAKGRPTSAASRTHLDGEELQSVAGSNAEISEATTKEENSETAASATGEDLRSSRAVRATRGVTHPSPLESAGIEKKLRLSQAMGTSEKLAGGSPLLPSPSIPLEFQSPRMSRASSSYEDWLVLQSPSQDNILSGPEWQFRLSNGGGRESMDIPVTGIDNFTTHLLRLVLQRVFAGQPVHPTGVARVEKLLVGDDVAGATTAADYNRAELRRSFLRGLRAPRLRARQGARRAVALARRGDSKTAKSITEILTKLRPELGLDEEGYDVLSRLCVACVASCAKYRDYATAHELLRLSQCFYQEHSTGSPRVRSLSKRPPEGKSVLKEYLSTAIQRQALYCEPAIWEFVLTRLWKKSTRKSKKDPRKVLLQCCKQVLVEMALSGLSLYHALSFLRKVSSTHELPYQTSSTLEMEAKALWETMSKSRSALTMTLTLALTNEDVDKAKFQPPHSPTAQEESMASTLIADAYQDSSNVPDDDSHLLRPPALPLAPDSFDGSSPPVSVQQSPMHPNPNLQLPMEEVQRGFGAECPTESPVRQKVRTNMQPKREMLCTFLGRSEAREGPGASRAGSKVCASPLSVGCVGQYAVSGDVNGGVSFYHIPTSRTIARFGGHNGAVIAISAVSLPKIPLSRDSSNATAIVMTGSFDGSLKAWSVPLHVNDVVSAPTRASAEEENEQKARARSLSPLPPGFASRRDSLLTRLSSMSSKQGAPGKDVTSVSYDDAETKAKSAKIQTVWQGHVHAGPIRSLHCVPIVNEDEESSNEDTFLCFSGSDDGRICVWAFPSGRCVATLSAYSGGGSYTPPGKQSRASAPSNKKGARGGSGVSALKGLEGHHPYVAAGYQNGTVRIWRITTIESGSSMSSSVLKGHTAAVTDVLWTTIASGDEGSYAEGLVSPTRMGLNLVFGLDSLPLGLRLVTSSLDRTIRIWNPRMSALTHTLIGHAGGVSCLQVHQDLGVLISGSQDCNIKVWDIGHLREGRSKGEEVTSVLTLCGHRDTVVALELTTADLEHIRSDPPRDGDADEQSVATEESAEVVGESSNFRILSAGEDGCLREWDLETGDPLQSHYGHTEGLTAAVVASQSRTLVTTSWDGSVRAWTR